MDQKYVQPYIALSLAVFYDNAMRFDVDINYAANSNFNAKFIMGFGADKPDLMLKISKRYRDRMAFHKYNRLRLKSRISTGVDCAQVKISATHG
ncbi:MAG: hypothetical protein ACI93R_003494 [Flavobacteriales bacterium]|jgi:hypothetical protein